MNRRMFGIVMAGFALLSPLQAADKLLVNVDKDGVALQAHDPVAFFTTKGPVKGKPEFSSEYKGARYFFRNAQNKAAFDKEPAKYEPQFGGFCAYGVGRGAVVPIRIEAWQIVDGRLLMQKDTSIRDSFSEDPKGNLEKADARWPKLVEKKGK